MNWRSRLAIIVILVGISVQADGAVVLDSDDDVATYVGAWTQAIYGVGFYGTDVATAPGGGAADMARFFTPRVITTTGTWCIQARWTTGPGRTTAAQYQIFDGPTPRATFTVNQQINGGAWRRLGCVPLTAGRIGEVRLVDTGVAAPSIVVADGVRWVWDEGLFQDFCIAVNGGFGPPAFGTTFVGKGFTMPFAGRCKPWSGIMKTATTVVGTSTGAACLSNDQKLLTITVQTTGKFISTGTTATDHIELCPFEATLGCSSGGQFDRGRFNGPATQIPCNAALVTIPSEHD